MRCLPFLYISHWEVFVFSLSLFFLRIYFSICHIKMDILAISQVWSTFCRRPFSLFGPLPGREEILRQLVLGLNIWAQWWTGEKDEVNFRPFQTLFLKPLF